MLHHTKWPQEGYLFINSSCLIKKKGHSAMQSHVRMTFGGQPETQLDGSVCQMSSEGGGKYLRLLAAALKAAPLTLFCAAALFIAPQRNLRKHITLTPALSWTNTQLAHNQEVFAKTQNKSISLCQHVNARLIATGFQRLFLSAANKLWTMWNLPLPLPVWPWRLPLQLTVEGQTDLSVSKLC